MHCRACDKLLSDKETNRKQGEEYPDLCNNCFGESADDTDEAAKSPLFEVDDLEGETNAVQSEDTSV